MNSRGQLLAIDGGGTKTDAVWFDETGHVHSRVIGPASNPNNNSLERSEQELICLLEELFSKNKDVQCNIQSVFAGLSGAGNIGYQTQIKKRLGQFLPRVGEIRVDHDAISALLSGTEGNAGMVLIAGTGTILYGQNESGQSFRIGGWGHLIGDEGGGFDIGKQVLAGVMKAYDGRGSNTLLTELVLEKFKKSSPEELVPEVYQKGKPHIASLVHVALRAAKSGDELALEIFAKASENLSDLVESGLKKFNTNPVSVVLTGGLWAIHDYLLLPVQNRFSKDEIRWIIPELPPVYGAAIQALKALKKQPSDRFKLNFVNSLNQGG